MSMGTCCVCQFHHTTSPLSPLRAFVSLILVWATPVYFRTKVRFGVVEAINGNIKSIVRRGRGYKNLGYLLLKAQRMAVTKTEFIVLQKAA